MTLQHLNGWRKNTRNPSALDDCVLIVPTYQRPRELVRQLNVLTRLPDAPGEVLIVDGSPGPNVNQVLRDWAGGRDLPFDLAYVNSPAGLTRQRNVGLDACNKKFIFYLDDDCLPEPGYFSSIRQVFIDDKASEIGAVRGFLTNGINKPLTRIWRLRFSLGLVPRGAPGQYFHSGSSATWDMVPTFKGTRPVDVLAGGASAYRREVFQKHRFSEYFYGYAQGEDLEMSLRIGRDWKLVVCGDALVNHDHADGGRPAGIPRGRMAVRNRYFIWKRHSANCRPIDRLRFWFDHVLVVGFNLLGFALRPWRPYNFLYALGTCMGIGSCLTNPPKYEEPQAQKQYEFSWEDLQSQAVDKISCSRV